MMSASKLFIAPFIFLVIFLRLNNYSCVGNNIIMCKESEQQALWALKRSQEHPSILLSSWASEVNCCKWKGVVCNNFTGHVHQLRLGGYNLTVKLNSSLLNLKHLRFLDMSSNNLSGKIPSFIGLFTRLKYLNLSDAGFHGTIPHTIGNLSNLYTLDLGSSYLNAYNLEWLSALNRLEHLHMNHVDLIGAINWVQVINKLPSLVELHLRSCNLNFFVPISIVNISSLIILDLSRNEFQQLIPKWIFQLRNLIFLDLSRSGFNGPIPSISNTTKLQHLDLFLNGFNSTIPNWLCSCKDLEFINLDSNSLRGTISNDIGNLSSLETLTLYDNMFIGKIPNSFGNMSNLKKLSFENNQLIGAIPSSLQKSSSLEDLGLSANKLTGIIPEWVGQLSKLEELYLHDNMFVGIMNENHFANLTNLISFVASRNSLSLKVKPDWVPPFQLSVLGLGSWDLGSATLIPPWLETQKGLLMLDLSDTGISGTIPNWIWEIKMLNLSHNNFHGQIPDINGTGDGYRFICLSSNQFSGLLPRVPSAILLDLSDNLLTGGVSHFLCDPTNATYNIFILLLGGNQLSGELPDCWMKWPTLFLLNVGDNNFSGSIPSSIGSTSMLSMNLYGNQFSGQIPNSLMNCTSIRKIDFGDNDLDGNIPSWMGTSLPYLRFLILRSNKLSSEIPSTICHLKRLRILDLSNNQFSGVIPGCVDNFTSMVEKINSEEKNAAKDGFIPAVFWVLIESAFISAKGRKLQYDTILSLVIAIDLSNNNLSGKIPKELTSLVELRYLNLSENHLMGSIPNNIGDMKQLESLDLSKNSFYGKLPEGFTNMFSLNYLNLSYNNLSGKIPESTQLRGFNPSSFVGNNLCGPPLTSSCGYGHGEFPKPRAKDDKQDNLSDAQWLYVFMSLGYGVGLSIACIVLVLKNSWRVTLFGIVEDLCDDIHAYLYIKWKRLQRQFGRS